METTEKKIFCGLFVFALLLAILLASMHDEMSRPRDELGEPFITDRVVTIRIVMDEKDWQGIMSNPTVEQYVRADFWFDGQRYPNVAARTKGNSSLRTAAATGSPRLSFKIDFNFFNSAHTFRGLKKLNLNNGFSDPTLIRETLGYELFHQMGVPAPRTAFVDLKVNDLHLGLYTQVEQIDKTFLARHFSNSNGNLYKPEFGAAGLNWTQADIEKHSEDTATSSRQVQVSKQAINIGGARLSDLLKLMERENSAGNLNEAGNTENDPTRPFTRGPGSPGNRFPGGPGEGFSRRGDNPFSRGLRALSGQDPNGSSAGPGRPRPFGPGGPFPGGAGRGFPPGMRGRGSGSLLEAMGLKTNENYQNHTALFRFLEVLNNCPDESFPTEIEKVLDVDATLRFLAASVMIVHLDNYIGVGHNYYLYEVDGKFTMLPWDLNMCFGTFNMGVFQSDIADFYIDEPTTGPMRDRPLVSRLLAHAPYIQRYHQHLEHMLEGCFTEGVIESRIDELIAMIRSYVQADETKMFSMEEFEAGINEGSPGGEGGMGFPADMRMPMELGKRLGMGPPRDGEDSRKRPRAFGPRGPGLKSFISKRRNSIRKQLDGELPSKPDAQQRIERDRPGRKLRGLIMSEPQEGRQ